MHEMFQYVLNKKDLSKAGDLFQVPDRIILNDLSAIINKVIEITSQPDYSHNLNDQSVVEICITRITSAIRENGSVELEGLALVSLLQTCLNHNLRPTTPDAAPPHAKIAADIVACIFLHYQQRSVMRLALPVAVKLLHKGNAELSRSISSYLSLAAIHSAGLLAQHTHTIVDSVIAGNYSLARILPGLYSEAQEPLQRHIMTLVSLLPRCHNPTDIQPLLQLFALVAGHKPALLENSLPQLLECLSSPSTALPTLQVVLILTKWRPTILTPYMHRIMDAVDAQPETLTIGLQVICVLGRVSPEVARTALDYTATHLPSVEKSGLAEVLREVGGVVSLYPDAVSDALLCAVRQFFDVFEYNGIEQQWGCFLCNHPDKAQGFVQDNTPVIEGQLKEKKSKWKLFRKWRTRYFTLSGAHLSYRGEHGDRLEEKGDIDVQRIRSVKVGKSGRHIPKAFEIFTDNKSFVLKAKDSSNAEEWVRCLSIVVAQQQVREKSSEVGALYSSNSVPLHHSAPLHHTTHSYRANRVSAASTGVCSSNSSIVWPGCSSSRISSNTSLPRSLFFNPHGGPSSSPPGTLPTLMANMHNSNAAAAAPLGAAILSQHAAAADVIAAANKHGSSTLPAGVTL
ncbi:hypothetical protein HAZT_HAZT011065, partial [Hyalella azteca]